MTGRCSNRYRLYQITCLIFGVIAKTTADTTTKTSVPDDKYAKFFRTPTQQANFERETEGDIPVKFCDNESWVTNHACCKSKAKWVSPDTAIDTNDKNVTLVHYEDNRQYFQSEECCQIPKCPLDCTCKQQLYAPMAVVYNSDGLGASPVIVRNIFLPGCCKCINNLNPVG